MEPTTDIFTLFRDLNVFKRNKKRFELKVIAVLLYAFGLLSTRTRGNPSVWFGVSLTRTTENALRFPRRLRGRCLGDPVILTDRGPWYRDAVSRAGFRNHVHQTFGLCSSVERFFGCLKDRTRVFYNNINPRKHSLHHS